MDDGGDNRPAFHAGFPNAAAEAADVPLDLNKLVVRNPTSTFYMRMASDSWQELGVNRGDILVIDRSLDPKPNDLVVISDGEEFALLNVPASRGSTDEAINVWGVVIWVVHERRKSRR